jgi:hypothetical protein
MHQSADTVIIDTVNIASGVKKWFEGDKITISEHKIKFSHPSYDEAFRYAFDSGKRDSDRRYLC